MSASVPLASRRLKPYALASFARPALSGLPALRLALARCDDQLARHLAAAVARYGSAALDVVDLPDFAPEAIDGEALHIAAVLLWTSELEAAGLPGFLEALAEQLADGRWLADLGNGGMRLLRWWRERSQRFTADERHGLYQRLFGDDSGFARDFSTLVNALDQLGRIAVGENPAHYRAQVTQAAMTLAGPLSRRATGIAAFAARDIIAQVRTAIELLTQPDIIAALGGQGPWAAIRLHGNELLGHVPACAVHLARARAGHQILTWLGEHAADLSGGMLAVSPGDGAVDAAQAWLAVEAG